MLTIVSAALALWALLRFLPAGWDGYGPLPYLISFIRFLWMPATVCLVLGVVQRNMTATAVSAAVVVLVAAVNSGWYRHMYGASAGKYETAFNTSATNQPSNANATTEFTVMTLNCRFGRANAEAIVQTVRSHNVTVLALQELTDELVSKLYQAGLQQLLPYHQLGEASDSDNGGFNGIWTSTKPTTSNANALDIQAAAVPGVSVNGIAFYSVHPKSPMRGCRWWSQGIRALSTLHTGTPKKSGSGNAGKKPQSPTIIMGDLNSSLSHPSFRATLTATGLRDSVATERHGTVASFPSWLSWPRLELDHALVSNDLGTSKAMAVPVQGSDHLALIVHISQHV